MIGAVPHRYGYRKCRCRQCQTIGYHQSGRVTRLLARREGVGWGWAFGWGYEFDWDAGRSVCRRCRVVLSDCKCAPVWALQLGIA